MKSLLAILVFVGVAWCNSTNYYGWTPGKELIYRFESQVLTGIPEIQQAQFAGIRLSSDVRVQTFSDYSLRVQFENAKFITVNGELNLSKRGRIAKGSETQQNSKEVEIPGKLKQYLEKPFLVHLKRGLVQSFFVESSEPHTISNIKRSFLSQIQLDLSASRRNEIESNHVPVQQLQGLEDPESDIPVRDLEGVTYFTTNEETLLGDCQTSYNIHPLPKYRALELEQQWKEEEKEIYQSERERSQGEEVCEGKEYFRIQKTKNLDNCNKNPFYQMYVGLESKCDGSKTACTDLYTHLVSTTCVVCGELDKFVIRKCLKKDIVSLNPQGWNTEENIKRSTTVSLELIKERSAQSPMNIPSDNKEKKSLIFEFPEANHQLSKNNQLEKDIKDLGISPVLPQPDLLSSPKLLFTNGIDKSDIHRQVVQELRRVAVEIFESPESCSSTGDAAGYIAAISKYLVPLSYEELKNIRDEVHSSSSHSQESQQVVKNLFFDVLSTVGTNPATMLIKKEIESRQITGLAAINALQGAIRSVRTPTEELLKELVQLVKSLKHIQNDEQDILETERSLFSIGMIQMSNLLYRACVNPARKNLEFPVRIYGQFCSNESSVITQEWIPFLEQELENPVRKHSEDEHFRLVAISSLGKLGHLKALYPLIKAIEGKISERPIVRSVAVYSLKRVARLNPVLVRPILLSIIDNPAENTQVRIAAVAILPWSQPSMAQLQKVAMRTWFEPSKQVSSFIYSTLKNLVDNEVPELKAVGLKAVSVLQMIKPQEYGVQFSQNINLGQFVDYLKTSISKKVSWVFNGEDLIPTKLAFSSKIFNAGMVARGPTFSVYTQGMDQLLEKALFFPQNEDKVSNSVKEQLEKISRELQLESTEEHSPMAYIQTRILGGERALTLNKEFLSKLVEKATQSLRRNSEVFAEGKHFEFSRSFSALDVQNMRPTSAGFLSYSENIIPVVYSVKGFIKAGRLLDGPIPVPTKVVAKVMPVINAKMHTHVGVLSPFTEEFIGAGVDMALHIATPLETEVEINEMNEVSVSVKTPESIKKAFEVIHAYITPYTVKKNLRTVQPISKSSQLKTIISNTPLKKIDLEFGKQLGVSSKLTAESDAQYVDLYSLWQKIKQEGTCPIYYMGILPGSLRRTSIKIAYNPTESETKEFAIRFHLAKGKRDNDNVEDLEGEEQISKFEEKLIKNICKEHYQSENNDNQRCQQQLKNLERENREVEELCMNMDEQEQRQCNKASQICEEAVEICTRVLGPQSKKCQELKESCKDKVRNQHQLKKMLKKIGQNSKARRLQIQVALKGRNSKNVIKSVLSYGLSKEEQGQVVKSFASAEIEVPEKSSTYQVAFESKAVLPKINHRWNTEKLVEEEVKLEVEGKLKYGRNSEIREVAFQSIMEKSQEQKQSIKQSPEFAKCASEQQKNAILSPVCAKVRHQAASIDKVWVKVQVPERLSYLSPLYKLEEIIKAYFAGQVSTHEESSVKSDRELTIQLDLSRNGDEAQFKVERPQQKWVVKDIRVPRCIQKVFPLSVRNNINDRLVQRYTHNQAPGSCRIEPEQISTFDNKTYRYELNDCMHVLYMDRSGRLPVAVMARSESQSEKAKTIEILSGVSKLVLKPKNNQQPEGLHVKLQVNGEQKQVELSQGQTEVIRSQSGRILVEMKRYHDNVYNIVFKREMLQVITDGERIEIIAPQLTRGRSAGLCGDYNGENTADLKTPKKCIMKKDRLAAYTYILEKQSDSSSENERCSGIPSQDREEFRRETQECIKKREIPTQLRNIQERLQQLAQPTISVHLVEKQLGQLCVSREKVRVCSKKTLNKQQIQTTYLEGIKPVELKQKLVEYSCVARPSQKADSLERRAKGGDNLQAELNRLPVHFTRVEYEPTLCKPQQREQQQEQNAGW